jgi:hypothetical protein
MLRFTAQQDAGLEKKNTGYENVIGKDSPLYMY